MTTPLTLQGTPVAPPPARRQLAFMPVALLEDAKISMADKLTLLGLNTFTNAQGLAWPSLRTLTELTGVSRSQVKRSLDVLEAAGWIVSRGVHARFRVNVYEVRLALPGAAVPAELEDLDDDEAVGGGVHHGPPGGPPVAPHGSTMDPPRVHGEPGVGPPWTTEVVVGSTSPTSTPATREGGLAAPVTEPLGGAAAPADLPPWRSDDPDVRAAYAAAAARTDTAGFQRLLTRLHREFTWAELGEALIELGARPQVPTANDLRVYANGVRIRHAAPAMATPAPRPVLRVVGGGAPADTGTDAIEALLSLPVATGAQA